MQIRFASRSFLVVLLCCLLATACASIDRSVNSGLWHFERGLFGQAIPLLLDGVPALEASTPTDPRVPRGYVALATMAGAQNKQDLADKFLVKAVDNARAYQARNVDAARNTFSIAGNHYLGTRRPELALPLLIDAAAISGREASIPRRNHAIDLDNVATANAELRDYSSADRYGEKALDILNSLEQTPAIQGTKGIVIYNHAYRLEAQKRNAEAEAKYRQAIPLFVAAADRQRLKVAVGRFVGLLRNTGRSAEADAIEAKYK